MAPPKRKERETIKGKAMAGRFTYEEARLIEDYQDWYDLPSTAEAIRRLVLNGLQTFKESA